MKPNQLPKFYETFIPILCVLKGGEVQHNQTIRSEVRDQFYSELPKDLLVQKTASGTNILLNRIGWALSYLLMAGYLERPQRGHYKITEKGRKAEQTGLLTLEELKQQAEYIAHQERGAEQKQAEEKGSQTIRPIEAINKEGVEDSVADLSPDELIEQGVKQMRAIVEQELLERVREMDPYEFEDLILSLLEKMGYGSVERTSKSNDGGVDGIVNQDQLGLDRIYMQAKRFNDQNVRETHIRDFIGAMSGDTMKGIFVTTSAFDRKAVDKAKYAHHKIVLIDGKRLAELLYNHGVGVQVRSTIEIKSADEDFFKSS